MKKQLILSVALTSEPEGGYSVLCTDLGVASQGETVEEALQNIKEAVELYLETAEEIGIMDEVLEKLGLTEQEFKNTITIPKVIRTEIPVELAV